MTASFSKFLRAAMMATSMFAPPIGGQPTPTFSAQQTYRDGLGRRRKIPAHPNHGKKRKSRGYWDFCARVGETHSDKPDTRADKYLNSYARRMRAQYPGQAASELFA